MSESSAARASSAVAKSAKSKPTCGHASRSLDAVGILGALEANGTVYSTDPRSGDQIELPFVGGKPEGETTLFILGGYDGGNVVEDWCPLVNFFSTRSAAEAWVEAQGVDGDIVSVAQIASDATDMWRPVVDQTNTPVC